MPTRMELACTTVQLLAFQVRFASYMQPTIPSFCSLYIDTHSFVHVPIQLYLAIRVVLLEIVGGMVLMVSPSNPFQQHLPRVRLERLECSAIATGAR